MVIEKKLFNIDFYNLIIIIEIYIKFIIIIFLFKNFIDIIIF